MKKSDISLIVEAFRLFPLNPNRIDEIVYSFNNRNMIIRHRDIIEDYIDEIYIEYVEFGTLHKKILSEMTNNGYTHEYIISYDIYYDGFEEYTYGQYEFITNHKKEADDVCENILLWLLSKGKNVSSIPLIINQMPALANLILSKKQ